MLHSSWYQSQILAIDQNNIFRCTSHLENINKTSHMSLYISSGFVGFGAVMLSFSSLRGPLFLGMVVSQSYQSN